MPRLKIILKEPIRFRYQDTPHAALVGAMIRAGAPKAQVIGMGAAPWTFGMSGRSFRGGLSRIHEIVLSTPDEQLWLAMSQMEGCHRAIHSKNGDIVNLSGSMLFTEPNPLHEGQEQITVSFASPFLVSAKREEKTYLKRVDQEDLSEAFSNGLTRRLGRRIAIDIKMDRLSAATEGSEPRIVRLKKTGSRDLIVPAMSTILTMSGAARDVRDAYFAGLGEKTRYGFGCPLALD